MSTSERCGSRCACSSRLSTPSWAPSRPRSSATPSARCSGSTATSASPRTRRRTRPTPAPGSITAMPGERWAPWARVGERDSTFTSTPPPASWPAASGCPPGPRSCASARRSPPSPPLWQRLTSAPGFRRRFEGLSEEAKLRRVPRGFPPDHPAAEWLKLQSFTARASIEPSVVTSPRLVDRLCRDFELLVPLVRWLNRALGYQPAKARR